MIVRRQAAKGEQQQREGGDQPGEAEHEQGAAAEAFSGSANRARHSGQLAAVAIHKAVSRPALSGFHSATTAEEFRRRHAIVAQRPP